MEEKQQESKARIDQRMASMENVQVDLEEGSNADKQPIPSVFSPQHSGLSVTGDSVTNGNSDNVTGIPPKLKIITAGDSKSNVSLDRSRIFSHTSGGEAEDRHWKFWEDDDDVHVFSEPPEVKVLNGIVEEAWPTKYVEYELKLRYKTFRWTIYVSRKRLYQLWFYVKGKGYAKAVTSHNHESIHFPQLRRLFLSSAEKAVSAPMLELVEQYITYVLSIPELLKSSRVLSILQVSASTFDEEGGYTSIKEGWFKLRLWVKGSEEQVQMSRGNVNCDNPCFNCLCVVKKVTLKRRKWRWVALKKSCIAFYATLKDTNPSEVILFDSSTTVERGVSRVGSTMSFIVTNSAFVAEVEGKSKQVVRKWANTIRTAINESVWSRNHRDESFSPNRIPNHVPCRVKFLIDGKDTYSTMYDVINGAKKEIFIAGWWICPDIYLLRPPESYPESRLDVLLKKKAEEGVQIYIQMYKEVTVALTLNSLYSKKTFKDLHHNVHVIRDPDFIVKQLGLWSHHEKIVCADQRTAFVGGLDLCFGRWDTPEHDLVDNEGGSTMFPGKDYSNPRIKDFIDVDKPKEDLMDRKQYPRMPWHDVHCVIQGQPARDAARHFIQRWNYTVFARGKSSKQPSLLPKPDYWSKENLPALSPKSRLRKAAKTLINVNQFSPVSSTDPHRGFGNILSHQSSLDEKHLLQKKQWSQLTLYETEAKDATILEGMMPCECQIVRSVGPWSAGTPLEHSIHNAYLRLIGEAKNFIYIENQFFVSGQEGDTLCNNRIANAIVNRIQRAHAAGEKFRVMVVMPLLPAFPGKPEAKDAYSLRGVMHWQYRSICRGETSIYETLYETIEDPFEYIAFFGLRTHGMSNENKPITEEIYIHSKTMIVDDSKVIIGSANINERSMLGDRDSEIAVVIRDTTMVQHPAKGSSGKQVGEFGHGYRMKLFEEHFGITPGTPEYEELLDASDTDTWFKVQEHAMKNSRIYENVFGCLPSDSILSFKELGVDRKPNAEKTFKFPLSERYEMQKERYQQRHVGTTAEALEVPPGLSPTSSVASITGEALKTIVNDNTDGLGDALTVNMNNDEDILEKAAQLSDVRGHIVYFPLNFLANEQLAPKLYPAELFQ